MRIAIVGGGIGGLTTALALKEFGFEAEVYEQAPVLLDVGAAIAVWPNALRVLEQLRVADTIHAHAGEIDRICWLDQRGFVINRVSIPKSVALHRADLQSTLLHALPQSWIKLGYSFLSHEQQNNKVLAKFANGEVVESDFVIGADGIHSDVRRQLLDDGPPSYRGYTVWRGIASAAPDAVSSNTAIEIHGRGQRFGIGPVGDGRVGWWATANATTEPHSSADTQSELLRLFKNWYRPAVLLIEATASNRILTTPAFDREASSTWGDKRVTLLGDAIHPTTPNLGQGGCLAMEDAFVLARCFAKYGATEQALRKYEGCRQSRTAAITRYSRMYGTLGQSKNLLAQAFKKCFIPLAPESIIQRLVKTVFDYDATTVTV